MKTLKYAVLVLAVTAFAVVAAGCASTQPTASTKAPAAVAQAQSGGGKRRNRQR